MACAVTHCANRRAVNIERRATGGANRRKAMGADGQPRPFKVDGGKVSFGVPHADTVGEREEEQVSLHRQ
jgi:hypothetical protein